MQGGQAIGCCLARACLGQCHQVVLYRVVQQEGDHLLLHRHRVLVALFRDGLHNLWAEAQFFKCLHSYILRELTVSYALGSAASLVEEL